MLAVTYWAALLAHHTEITGTSPVLKAKGTGNPIQARGYVGFVGVGSVTGSARVRHADLTVLVVATCVPQVSSSDFTVVDGVLKIRGSESSDSGRRLAGEATVTPTGTVGVRMSMQRRKLSSTLPDKYFKELKHFEVTNDFGRCGANYCAVLHFTTTSAWPGSSMALDISAVVRIPRRKAPTVPSACTSAECVRAVPCPPWCRFVTLRQRIDTVHPTGQDRD